MTLGQILLLILSASSCIAAIAVTVGNHLRNVRNSMPVSLYPRSREVLCERDLGAWQPEGGDQ